MSFARSAVKFCSNDIALGLSEIRHACAFGQELPYKPVGILVSSTLPRVIRIGEIEAGFGVLFDLLVLMKLSAIICCNRHKARGFTFDQTDNFFVE